jgi:exonuclease SbcC
VNLRLKSLKVSGFRGFGNSLSFDLDADAVVIIGANGQGKTSLFDALLWALAGEVERLDTKDAGLMSLYSADGQMRVEVTLKAGDRTERRIVREFDGVSSPSSVLWDDGSGSPKKGLAAESALLDELWPPAVDAKETAQSLGMVLTRANYLQQDLLCQFIGSDSDESRFAVLAELLGAGRLRELTVALERAQKSYTTTTNEAADKLRLLESRQQQLATGLAEVAVAVDVDSLAARWRGWWSDFLQAGGTTEEVSDFRAAAASAQLDAAARELTARRDVTVRRSSEMSGVLERYSAYLAAGDQDDELAELDIARRRDRDQLQADVQSLQQRLLEAQQRAEHRRAEAIAQTETREELRALAELALRHLDGPCPVCEQPHDADATRRHLENLINSAGTPEDLAVSQDNEVAEAQAELLFVTTRLSALQSEIEVNERREDSRRRGLEEIDATAERLALVPQSPNAMPVVLQSALDQLTDQLSRIGRLLGEVEPLALDVARLAAQARRAELEREMTDVRSNLADRQHNVRVREETRRLSGRILDGLRETTEAFVKERLADITPLLQAIYDSIDPHPTLQNVELLPRTSYGRARLDAQVSDPEQRSAKTTSPPMILSSSQSNALAVAIFLTLNLSTPSAPLASLLLDDPLQSLDRINLLGLVDVLRRTAPARQLIVATHDDAFGQLLARKLRPAHRGSRTIVIRLGGWSRSGPTVETASVEAELGRLVS